jgi:hypothetical protein
VTVGIASQALPAASSATTYAAPGTAGQTAHSPHVNGAVVTSGGSGAVATGTQVVNGRSVVTSAGYAAGNN